MKNVEGSVCAPAAAVFNMSDTAFLKNDKLFLEICIAQLRIFLYVTWSNLCLTSTLFSIITGKLHQQSILNLVETQQKINLIYEVFLFHT